jgi:hypothetical protein
MPTVKSFLFYTLLLFNISYNISLVCRVSDFNLIFYWILFYLIITSLALMIEAKNIIKNVDYFTENKYGVFLSFFKSINIVFGITSLIFFLSSNKLNLEYNDTNINIFFYNGCIFSTLLSHWYTKNYSVEESNNRIQPQERSEPQERREPQEHHEPREEKELKDNLNLKGKIENGVLAECAVCLDNESLKETQIIILDCSHNFHYDCLQNCYNSNIKKCPMCRITFVV